jgi:hypothetical protein
MREDRLLFLNPPVVARSARPIRVGLEWMRIRYERDLDKR